MANQDLKTMIAEFYTYVGEGVGQNNYCIVMGKLESIKAKVSLEVLGNVSAENVGMQQGIAQQPPAQNVVVEQVIQQQQPAQNVVLEQGIQQQQPTPAATPNVVMEQGIEQQPTLAATQNIVPPTQVPNLDALSRAVCDDWRSFDGQNFESLSADRIFWFNRTLTEYMITSCRIRICKSEIPSFTRRSPRDSFVHSMNFGDRSIPVILLSSRLPAPPTPGLIFCQAETKLLFLYWPGLNKYFQQHESINVSYQWKRSRTDGRFLLMVTMDGDSSLLQSSTGGGQQTRAMTAGHSNAIGGTSGSAEPQDRGETSAAGASRARHGTSPHLTSRNQLLSSRVLRSMTRGQT